MLPMAFGISSVVFSIIAIFVPVFGVFVAGLSGILAWLSVGRAAFLGLTAVIINILNIFLLSPAFLVILALEASQRTPDQSQIYSYWMVVFIIQIVAPILYMLNILFHFLLRKGHVRSFSRSKSAESSESATATDITGGKFGSFLSVSERPQESKVFSRSSTNHPIMSDSWANSPTRLTRVLANKIHGGRKQSAGYWNDGGGISDISIEGKKQSRAKEFSPLIMGFITLLLGGLIWGGYNFHYSKPYSPLSRVYEKEIAERILPQRKSVKVDPTPLTKTKISRKTETEISEINRPTGVLYSWIDKDGKTHFSNVAPAQDAVSVKTEIERNPYDNRTKVQITGNTVYVPVTLTYSGKKIDTSLLLDTGCSTTVVPSRITKYLNAKHLGLADSIVADGRVVKNELKLVDNFIVGSFVHRSFKVKSRENAGSRDRGLLGMDFLKHHPFTIDYRNQFIVWQ